MSDLAVYTRVCFYVPHSILVMSLPRCFDELVKNFEIKKCESSRLVVFQDCFSYFGSPELPCEFKMDHSIS